MDGHVDCQLSHRSGHACRPGAAADAAFFRDAREAESALLRWAGLASEQQRMPLVADWVPVRTRAPLGRSWLLPRIVTRHSRTAIKAAHCPQTRETALIVRSGAHGAPRYNCLCRTYAHCPPRPRRTSGVAAWWG